MNENMTCSCLPPDIHLNLPIFSVPLICLMRHRW